MNINNPYNLEIGKIYFFKYIHCKSDIFNGIISRFTVDGYPWCDSNKHCGIISQDSYEIYTLDGDVICNPNKSNNILNFREFIKEYKNIGVYKKTNIIRKLKLIDIVDIEWSVQEIEIINLVNFWLKDLFIFKDPDRPDGIYYMKDNKWVLQLDNNSKRLFVRYPDFWEILDKKIGMDYTDIQNLIKGMIERSYKEILYTSNIGLWTYHLSLEESFNKQQSKNNLNFGKFIKKIKCQN